ncbi:hypothetical protein AAFX19_22325 [Vibrio harveyi]|uniref:hypothetical protein n=1 Tax=Vibrio harveyi TaxID=669 RepID=UPI0038CD4AA1
MKECILCGDSTSKLTAEHVVQASILKEILRLEKADKEGVVSFRVNELKKHLTNIDRASLLKPRKNICVKCNSNRSTLCDEEFHNLVIKLFFYSKERNLDHLRVPNHAEISNHILSEINDSGFYDVKVDSIEEAISKFSFEGVMPLITEFLIIMSEKVPVEIEDTDKLQISRFLAKHAACNYFHQNVEIPHYLRDIFVDSTQDSRLSFDFYLVSCNHDLGFSTTAVYFFTGYNEYYFTFKHVVVRVRTATC